MRRNTSAYDNRFPHECTIYRMVGEDEVSDGEKEILYQGECHIYSTTTLRNFGSKNVELTDYACDIPVLIKGLTGGLFFDGKDYGVTFEREIIQKPQAVKYGDREGTTVYFNHAFN